MDSSARSRARSLQRLLALIAAIALLIGLVPPVSEAAPDLDPAKVEPALQRGLAAKPSGTFQVIVTRPPPKDRNERRRRAAEVEKEITGEGGRIDRRLGLVEGHAVTLTARQIARLSRSKKVKSISLDHKVQLTQITTAPMDGTAGAPLASTNVGAAGAPQVWAQGNTGQGVTVAVFDSGVTPSPDLPTAVHGVDTVTHTTALGDLGGHGSHVAGIIAGNGSQSAGAYKGLAPGARVVSVKVTDDQGHASYSSIIAGIAWVLANQRTYNFRVANLSLGASPQGGYIDDPLDAAVEALWFRGVVVVASAGNKGPGAGTIDVPGNDPYVITVGAVDDNQTASLADDVVPDWSSRGPTAFDGLSKPDLAASGRRVVSLRAVGSTLDLFYGVERVVKERYFRLSGTSMSTPAVSGVAALMLAANPYLTPNQVKAILIQTARPIAGASASAVGAGELDAAAAVQLALNPLGLRANAGLTPSRGLVRSIWPALKQNHPKWRHTGWWMGRYWVNGSWDLTSGFKPASGGWDDTGWDALAQANLDWGNLTFSDAGWNDCGWDDSGWDSGSWDDSGWDDSGWDSIAVN
ncbi:MAG TPA: S8 family peptidase [Chloroflexota bacterium]